MVKIRRLTTLSGSKDVEKLELLPTADRNVKWCKHFGKLFDSLFKS